MTLLSKALRFLVLSCLLLLSLAIAERPVLAQVPPKPPDAPQLSGTDEIPKPKFDDDKVTKSAPVEDLDEETT